MPKGAKGETLPGQPRPIQKTLLHMVDSLQEHVSQFQSEPHAPVFPVHSNLQLC